jgi:hypothetical protein
LVSHLIYLENKGLHTSLNWLLDGIGKNLIWFTVQERRIDWSLLRGKHIYSSFALMAWFGSCPWMPQLEALAVHVPGLRCPECV